MSRSFRSERAERIWREQHVECIDRAVQRAAPRRLELIHAAHGVEEPRIPVVNRAGKHVGDRRGQHSIQADAQCRICSSREEEVRRMSNPSATAEGDSIEPIHPGEILREDIDEGAGSTSSTVAVSTDAPPRHLHEIVRGTREITADAAIRLERPVETTEELWRNRRSDEERRGGRRAGREQVDVTSLLRSA